MKQINLNLVGCGGVGLKIARELSSGPIDNVSTLNLWDSDIIEDRNLERQIFKRDQVGISKSEATKELFFSRNKNVRTLGDVTEASLWSEEFLNPECKWIENCVWIMATDNIESRLLMLAALDSYGQKDSLLFSAANATADDGLGIGSTAWVYKKSFEGGKHDPRVRDKLSSEESLQNGRPCTESSEPQTAIANSGAAIRCVELLIQYCASEDQNVDVNLLSKQHSLFWKQVSK